MKGTTFAGNCGVLFVFALVGTLLLTGYRGLTHDAVLYSAQAINVLDPGSLSQDLFFQFGSQQRFTVFPQLYAASIEALGVGGATLVLFLLTRLLLAAALVVLVVHLVEREARLAALIGILVLAGHYGGGGVFAFGEAFVTARSLAEPLVVVGLALAIARRYLAALAPIAVSAAFHPLAVVGPALAVYLLAFGRRGLWWLAAAVPAVLISGWLGVEPFSWLYQRYDGAWWAVIAERNDYALLAQWGAGDWTRLLADAAVLAAAGSAVSAGGRRLLRYLLPIAALLFVLAALGEAGRVRLLFALQLWRVHAWLHLLACACAVPLALHWWRGHYQLAATILLLALLFAGSVGALPLLVLAGALRWRLERLIGLDKRGLLRALLTACLLASIALPLLWIALGGNTLLLQVSLHFWLLYGGLAAWLWLTLRYAHQGFLVGLVAVLVIATAKFDRRTPLAAALMSGALDDVFGQHVGRGDTTYWHNSLEVAWVARHLPSYYADKQGAGLLFNRGTAMEFARRQAQLGFLEKQQEVCVRSSLFSAGSLSDRCAVTYSEVMTACTAAPELDFIVLLQPEAAASAVAVAPAAAEFLNLFACEDARAGG